LSELPGPETVLPQGAAIRFEDGAVLLTLSTDIYSVGAILRSCYWLTDRCYVHLAPSKDGYVEATLLAKTGNEPETSSVAWQFLNDLVDNQLRVSIQEETAGIRDMIVAQAFSDVEVIDDRGRRVEPGSTPGVDQSAITTWRPVA
jgi:His-Xaa-Ser system protein HxsD